MMKKLIAAALLLSCAGVVLADSAPYVCNADIKPGVTCTIWSGKSALASGTPAYIAIVNNTDANLAFSDAVENSPCLFLRKNGTCKSYCLTPKPGYSESSKFDASALGEDHPSITTQVADCDVGS